MSAREQNPWAFLKTRWATEPREEIHVLNWRSGRSFVSRKRYTEKGGRLVRARRELGSPSEQTHATRRAHQRQPAKKLGQIPPMTSASPPAAITRSRRPIIAAAFLILLALGAAGFYLAMNTVGRREAHAVTLCAQRGATRRRRDRAGSLAESLAPIRRSAFLEGTARLARAVICRWRKGSWTKRKSSDTHDRLWPG